MKKLFLIGLLLSSQVATAGIFSKSPAKSAEEAAAAAMPAVTIFVDATWGFRKQGAANSLSDAHRAFYTRGYHVVSVQPYIENADLVGFFVTYERNR